MPQIHVLDSETIDKIAAGEVVERPASVVKELVENAMDAGARAITVEIKDGGIEFIRVTDNGAGIAKDQIRNAFLRHATSKIKNADDLMRIASLGFRGEALSSIAAVSKVELVTKTKDSLTGIRMVLEGAEEKEFSEIGAPDGTTFMVRNLFYNTPVRRKFLKLPATEGSYIADLMEHLALSRPDISFKFQNGSQLKFHTTGSGDLREVIYRIYGRDIAASLVPIRVEQNGNKIEGFLGKPVLVRSNRNFEIYFINGRFIRSNLLAKSIEIGYKEYLMQHKFPFCVLHITMDAGQVDVNVHPTKMDVRFSDGITFSKMLSDAVSETLKQSEMIPEALLSDEKEEKKERKEEQKIFEKTRTPEPFEQNRTAAYLVMEEAKYHAEASDAQKYDVKTDAKTDIETDTPTKTQTDIPKTEKTDWALGETIVEKSVSGSKPEQLNLFEEKLLSASNRPNYRIIGQVFGTYWLVQHEDKMLIIDQHAAHEKVKYERLMKQFREGMVVTQSLMPPVVVTLSAGEESVLSQYLSVFQNLGFEIESFGGKEYALRGVPADLYGLSEKELFLSVLDELAEGTGRAHFSAVEEKIASMSCKAAVKGNHSYSPAEAEKLIDELLTLENPYNCPHGRPTIVTMSQYEMDKKFKRII